MKKKLNKPLFISIGISILLIPIVVVLISLQYPNTEQSKYDTQEYTFYWEQLPLVNSKKKEMELTKKHIKVNNFTIRNALNLLVSDEERKKIVVKSNFARYRLLIKRKPEVLIPIEDCFLKALEVQRFIRFQDD